MAEMLFCRGIVARHLQTGGTLPSASSGSSVTTQGCSSLLLVMAACAQGHLNLIPALLSLPMVEHHFIPRTYHRFGRIRERINIDNSGQEGNVHTNPHNLNGVYSFSTEKIGQLSFKFRLFLNSPTEGNLIKVDAI